MYTTTELQLFIRTADTGNLSRAARDLDLSVATASAGLKRLEQRLATHLFVRSTRSMRLTPEGETFLEYCRHALALLDEGEAMLSAGRKAVRGPIRLSAPSDLGRNVLLPWLNAFQQQHPDIMLTLRFSDHMMDLIRDPVDLAFRYGPLEDSSLVSQHVTDNPRVAVASPAYLEKHGTPLTPKDLEQHNCLLYYLKQGLFNNWRFRSGRNLIDIKVRGDRMADDGAIVREWAVSGFGIAYKSWLDVRHDVERGKLVTILNDYQGDDVPLNVVFPHRNSVSPGVRALVAFIRDRFLNRS
jgi:DNA-binding transcriptional LysR family regulator